jgi:hypothetical protein
MKPNYFLLILILLCSCEEDQLIFPETGYNETKEKSISNFKNDPIAMPHGSTDSPVGNLTAVNALFYKDVVYHTIDSLRTIKFDIFIPNIASDSTVVPLVIYIHGGGFNNRTKEDAYDGERHPYKADIKKYLKKGIAYATIDFRYKTDFKNISPGGTLNNIEATELCLEDVKRCLQFIRYNAPFLGINKQKIGAYGGSSGGCSALWLGLKDNMASHDVEEISVDPISGESTRLQAIGHYNSQCSYEKQFLLDVFFNAQNNCLFPGPIDPAPGLDFPKFISADDPDMYFFNDNAIDCSTTDKIGHHPYHAMILKNKAEEVIPNCIATGKVVAAIASYNIPIAGTIVPSRNKSLANFMISRLR